MPYRPPSTTDFTPDPDQMALWPPISGNQINRLGDDDLTRPAPVYWHDPALIAHGPLQKWFYQHNQDDEVDRQRAKREEILNTPLPPLADSRTERSAEEWSRLIKAAAIEAGADDVGITELRQEWVFEGYEAPYRWMVMIAVAMDHNELKTAPAAPAIVEVIRQYARGQKVAQEVAGYLRREGWDAHPHCGPLAGPVLLIPPAIEAGLGELGKHGSMISRKFGASFRLACVMSNVPLVADRADSFGVDDFCARCHACENACPPDAIFPAKQMVRGSRKWYVDFDKCLPYFNESFGCGICLAVCPWSFPGVPDGLVAKIARRQQRLETI